MILFSCKSEFRVPVEELFRFHEEPVGFETLVAQSPGVRVIRRPRSIQPGEVAILEIPVFPGIRARWMALHTKYEKNRLFCDEQKEGPFHFFRHSHLFQPSPDKEGWSLLEDRIECEAFFPLFSDRVVPFFLKPQFLKRHEATARALGIEWKHLGTGFEQA